MFRRLFSKKKKKEDVACGSSSVKKRDPPHITWKHSWTPTETEQALAKSRFGRIPIEILLKIFQNLSVRDLCNTSLVCRLFKMVADQDDIWKLKCDTSVKLYSKSFKQIHMDWMYDKYLRQAAIIPVECGGLCYRSIRVACVCSTAQYQARPTVEYPNGPVGGFRQHPNSSKDMTITLSVDIDETTYHLISLLKKASQYQDKWYQPAVLKQMITRYYRFMQLKALYLPNVLLIPTIDIEIVWQTHLLRPEMYRADCMRLFRHIVDHSLLTTDIQHFLKEQAFRETCQFYEERFKEKYCELPSEDNARKSTFDDFYDDNELRIQLKSNYSYWDQTSFEFSSNPPKQFENPFSFTEAEIILDGRWLDLCKKFMYESSEQVPIGDYYLGSEEFIDLGSGVLARLKKSYERFLYMAAKYPLKYSSDFVPPTYAIDIIWHAHMQEPLKYEADCLRLVGYIMLHWPRPIIEDEKMKNESKRTGSIWKQEFQSEISTDHHYNAIDASYDL